MKRIVCALAVAVGLAGPVAAQQELAVYQAWIGPQDMVNSSGVPLGDLCTMVQQDRANFHRFNRSDGSDDWDPVFSDRAMRGQIPGACELALGNARGFIMGSVANRQPVYIRVRVLMDGGRLRVIVSEGAG